MHTTTRAERALTLRAEPPATGRSARFAHAANFTAARRRELSAEAPPLRNLVPRGETCGL